VRRSSVFNFAFAFFHSFAGLGRGEEGSNGDDWPTSPASSRLLFFDPPVFLLLAGDPFILQVTDVFSRIHSGAVVEADRGRGRKWI
jgi:hypothetical protein